MKIPKNLPQFEKSPTLFLVSGEFEARFLVARNGEIAQTESFAFNPREEAKEKQAFVGKKGGMQSLSAVSHHGRYIEDLKEKSLKKIRDITDDISRKEFVDKIQIFAPAQTKKRILNKLSQESKEKVDQVFTGHYLKESPLFFLEMIEKSIAKKRASAHIHITKEEKKIIHKPSTKPRK